jgi:hypothetical protein
MHTYRPKQHGYSQNQHIYQLIQLVSIEWLTLVRIHCSDLSIHFLTIKPLSCMSHLSIASHIKRKPASLIGAPISAQETQQLKKAFAEKYPDQVPAVYISKELILKSIAGVSNVSGILFSYGLSDSAAPATRKIAIVPCRNKSNGESGIIPVISPTGYVCDNGEQIGFDKLLTLLGNHVTNFRGASIEIPLTKLPRGYFWGVEKLMKFMGAENCAGIIFHFGYNPELRAACRQFQCVLEIVDANRNSLHAFMEYGQCTPPCDDEGLGVSSSDCVASIAADRFANNADSKLNELRAFRDNWLLQQENGQALFEMYYFLSGAIVAEIKDRPDQESIWQEIYNNGLSKCLDLIDQQKHEDAKAFYINMMRNLTQQFLNQDV